MLQLRLNNIFENGHFEIVDDSKRVRYFVHVEIYSWSKKYRVLDHERNEVLLIESKEPSSPSKYSLFIRGEEVAQIKTDFTFYRAKYEIVGDWSIEGDFTQDDYVINYQGEKVATIKRLEDSMTQTLIINISDETQELMCLGIVIALESIRTFESNPGR